MYASKSNWSVFGVGWGHLKCGGAKYQTCREVDLHCIRHGLWLQPMQFSLRREFAIQLQEVLLPERFYLKSVEDASHLWSQANDRSCISFKDLSIPAQHGSDLRENVCRGVPSYVRQLSNLHNVWRLFSLLNPTSFLLLWFWIPFWEIFLSNSPFTFQMYYPNKLFSHLSYHFLSIEFSGHSIQLSNLVTL